MDQLTVAVEGDTEILGITSRVDDPGLDRIQFGGQQLPRQVRLDEPWTGHIVDALHALGHR